MFTKVNTGFLFLSIAGFITAFIMYFFSNQSLITTFQLLFTSISSIALFASLRIISLSNHKLNLLLQMIGYITFFSSILTFVKSELLVAIWNIQISAILFLLFTALDAKLELTQFYNNSLFKWIYRLSSTFLILSSLLKLNYTIIFSIGTISLILLSIISFGGILKSRKN